MILITLSTFLAVIVINTHIRGDRKNRVPNWLRRVSYSFSSQSVHTSHRTAGVGKRVRGTSLYHFRQENTVVCFMTAAENCRNGSSAR